MRVHGDCISVIVTRALDPYDVVAISGIQAMNHYDRDAL